jgi:hypothetical protein
MHDTYDFMLNATDPHIGYPADGNRLVQRSGPGTALATMFIQRVILSTLRRVI